MENDTKSSCRNENPACIGVIWFIGWLFTIGFAKLVWWKAAIALLFWAYYLGQALS